MVKCVGKPIHWEVGGHYDSPLTESRWRTIGIVVTIGLNNFSGGMGF